MTPRTRQALTLKANGLQSKQIAEIMEVDRRTVEYHLKNARIELGAKSICHAIARAVRDGVILASDIGIVLLLSWTCFAGSVDIRRGPQPPTVARSVSRSGRREV